MDSADPRIRGASYSRLVVFESCPYHAYLEYAVKEPKPEEPDDARQRAERGTLIHTAAEGYVRGTEELHVELKKPKVKAKLEEIKQKFEAGLVTVEEEWAYDASWGTTGWFDKNVWLRVKLDAGITMGTHFEVVDYKTGKRFGNEVKHSQQGLLYAVSTIMRYAPIERVKVCFVYTDQNQVWEREFDREVVARLAPGWAERINTMLEATQFKAKPNKINCRFCPYRPKKSGGTGRCEWGVEV